MGANVESFRNLEENLKAHGMRLQDMPHVIQFNKRDLPRLSNIEDLNASINRYNAPFYESVATTGIGVQDTLKAIVKLVLLHLTRKYETKPETRPAPAPPERPVAVSPLPSRPAVARAAPPVATAPRPFAEPARGPAGDVRSIPVSSYETPFERPAAIPVAAAPTPEPRPLAAVPPPPDFREAGGAADGGLAFADEEIDHLVDEVEDFGGEEEEPVAADDVEWRPVTAAPVLEEPVPIAIEPPSPARAEAFEAPPATPPALEAEETPDEAEAAEADWSLVRSPAEIVESRPPVRTDPLPASDPRFEVDLGFDPSYEAEDGETCDLEPIPISGASEDLLDPIESFASGTVIEEAEPLTDEDRDAPAVDEDLALAAGADSAEAPVVLSEVAEDGDLFADPNLEVARLQTGEAREIVVPVEIGEGAALRRFRLSVRLRLDPLD